MKLFALFVVRFQMKKEIWSLSSFLLMFLELASVPLKKLFLLFETAYLSKNSKTLNKKN